jgi:deoxyribodipyrimidine photolyase-related protein
MPKTLIPIFADQLTDSLTPLVVNEPADSVILMTEVRGESDSAAHHKAKLAFLFSAMRHFANSLRAEGWTVRYVKLTDSQNSQSFTGEIQRALDDMPEIEHIHLTEPSEYRVLSCVQNWRDAFDMMVTISPDQRFIASHDEFADWAEGRKLLRMEYFYRDMRRKTQLLMEGDKPEGGKWNYDSENRKPPKSGLNLPPNLSFKPDDITQEVLDMVAAEFPNRFGALDHFFYGVTQADARKALDYFILRGLPEFGDYQDAMMTGEPFLFHSLLSLYLNIGLLTPLEICRAVEAAYKSGDAPLNAAEGYIRQIIGWREYVRGIYWLKMPHYLDENALGAQRDLPDFYWTGETDMHCLSQAIGQTKDYAYAHHIQRLMITGNFALLIGANPKQVHEWYLAVYMDAFEWVELPNTLGMSQFADGGLLGSKPYASSGAYINRMSNYCKSCKYKVTEKTGDTACPFNSLYWHFIDRNKEALSGNPRMAMPYRNWAKMDEDKKQSLRAQADKFLAGLEPAKSTYF